MSFPKIDITLERTLKEVQTKFKDKFGTDISLRQVYLIIAIQEELTTNAVFTGKGIRLPNIGKFGITAKKSKYMTTEDIQKQEHLQTNGCLIQTCLADDTIGY